MKKVQLFSHQGWFGICPVYIADLDSDAPHLTLRVENAFYESLFWVSHFTFMAFFTVTDLLLPNKPLGFPIVVTGELLVPYRYEYEED